MEMVYGAKLGLTALAKSNVLLIDAEDETVMISTPDILPQNDDCPRYKLIKELNNRRDPVETIGDEGNSINKPFVLKSVGDEEWLKQPCPGFEKKLVPMQKPFVQIEKSPANLKRLPAPNDKRVESASLIFPSETSHLGNHSNGCLESTSSGIFTPSTKLGYDNLLNKEKEGTLNRNENPILKEHNAKAVEDQEDFINKLEYISTTSKEACTFDSKSVRDEELLEQSCPNLEKKSVSMQKPFVVIEKKPANEKRILAPNDQRTECVSPISPLKISISGNPTNGRVNEEKESKIDRGVNHILREYNSGGSSPAFPRMQHAAQDSKGVLPNFTPTVNKLFFVGRSENTLTSIHNLPARPTSAEVASFRKTSDNSEPVRQIERIRAVPPPQGNILPLQEHVSKSQKSKVTNAMSEDELIKELWQEGSGRLVINTEAADGDQLVNENTQNNLSESRDSTLNSLPTLRNHTSSDLIRQQLPENGASQDNFCQPRTQCVNIPNHVPTFNLTLQNGVDDQISQSPLFEQHPCLSSGPMSSSYTHLGIQPLQETAGIPVTSPSNLGVSVSSTYCEGHNTYSGGYTIAGNAGNSHSSASNNIYWKQQITHDGHQNVRQAIITPALGGTTAAQGPIPTGHPIPSFQQHIPGTGGFGRVESNVTLRSQSASGPWQHMPSHEPIQLGPAAAQRNQFNSYGMSSETDVGNTTPNSLLRQHLKTGQSLPNRDNSRTESSSDAAYYDSGQTRGASQTHRPNEPPNASIVVPPGAEFLVSNSTEKPLDVNLSFTIGRMNPSITINLTEESSIKEKETTVAQDAETNPVAYEQQFQCNLQSSSFTTNLNTNNQPWRSNLAKDSPTSTVPDESATLPTEQQHTSEQCLMPYIPPSAQLTASFPHNSAFHLPQGYGYVELSRPSGTAADFSTPLNTHANEHAHENDGTHASFKKPGTFTQKRKEYTSCVNDLPTPGKKSKSGTKRSSATQRKTTPNTNINGKTKRRRKRQAKGTADSASDPTYAEFQQHQPMFMTSQGPQYPPPFQPTWTPATNVAFTAQEQGDASVNYPSGVHQASVDGHRNTWASTPVIRNETTQYDVSPSSVTAVEGQNDVSFTTSTTIFTVEDGPEEVDTLPLAENVRTNYDETTKSLAFFDNINDKDVASATREDLCGMTSDSTSVLTDASKVPKPDESIKFSPSSTEKKNVLDAERPVEERPNSSPSPRNISEMTQIMEESSESLEKNATSFTFDCDNSFKSSKKRSESTDSGHVTFSELSEDDKQYETTSFLSSNSVTSHAESKNAEELIVNETLKQTENCALRSQKKEYANKNKSSPDVKKSSFIGSDGDDDNGVSCCKKFVDYSRKHFENASNSPPHKCAEDVARSSSIRRSSANRSGSVLLHEHETCDDITTESDEFVYNQNSSGQNRSESDHVMCVDTGISRSYRPKSTACNVGSKMAFEDALTFDEISLPGPVPRNTDVNKLDREYRNSTPKPKLQGSLCEDTVTTLEDIENRNPVRSMNEKSSPTWDEIFERRGSGVKSCPQRNLFESLYESCNFKTASRPFPDLSDVLTIDKPEIQLTKNLKMKNRRSRLSIERRRKKKREKVLAEIIHQYRRGRISNTLSEWNANGLDSRSDENSSLGEEIRDQDGSSLRSGSSRTRGSLDVLQLRYRKVLQIRG